MERNPKTTATMTTKMTKTSAGKKSPEKNPNGGRRQRKVPGTALYDWFIAIFGVAFVLSFSMNVMQLTVGNRSNDTNDIGGKGHSSKREAARSALRRAMKDFRGKPRNEAGAKRMAFEVGGGGNNEAGSLTKLAALDCKAYGGPSLEAAQEMVYWQDIHSDSNYVPPFFETNNRKGTKRRYLTFEPDGGGWNNIRMAMESTIALSVAMGRTLVMPPQKRMYLLGKGQGGQRHHFSFVDFFPIEEMAEDNKAFEVISMKEYLEEEAMEGNLVNRETGKVEFPPGNRTDWDNIGQDDYDVLRGYLRKVSHTLRWKPGQCLPAFPSSGNHKDVEILQGLATKTRKAAQHVDHVNLHRVDDPSPAARLEDTLAGRKDLCVYDEEPQNARVVHFQMNHKEGLRLLVHFYAFLFFEDWREDLWMKRFVRDHLHYKDEIQCAAARIVEKIRKHVSKKTVGKTTEFDTFHIRRGDFQFKNTRIDVEEIIKNSEEHLTPGSTIFIATDEGDKNFFEPMKKIYDIMFLDDFKDELKGVNSNYYGMIDQLVASRGRVFLGCWFSTFTGYIMRIRGYHSVKDKAPGHEHGVLPTSYYYVTKDREYEMHKYAPLRGGFFNREFPTSWRDIDKGIAELASISRQG